MNPPKNISQNAQLIEGVGASSWFTIATEKEQYRIERFSPEGELECSRLFEATPNTFDINSPYEFTYLSHCKKCTIIQDKLTFNFHTNEY